VAQGGQINGFFCGLNTGDSSYCKEITLGKTTIGNCRDNLWCQLNLGLGNSPSAGSIFGRYIDHMGFATGV
jgi:hypothetical protein